MLPRDVARCPGMQRKHPPGAWPFPSQEEDCLGCARRTEGIRDYMSGADVVWMQPPGATPCQERLEPKK